MDKVGDLTLWQVTRNPNVYKELINKLPEMPKCFEESYSHSKEYIGELEKSLLFEDFDWKNLEGSLQKFDVDGNKHNQSQIKVFTPKLPGFFQIYRWPYSLEKYKPNN